MANNNIYKANNEISLKEMLNDEVTSEIMNSDKVTCDDLIALITDAKNRIVSGS